MPSVGDPIVVLPGYRGSQSDEDGAIHCTVTRVGRSLFDATRDDNPTQWNAVHTFRVENWVENMGNTPGTPSQAFTPEEWAERPERSALLQRLQGGGMQRPPHWGDLTIDQLRRVIATLDEADEGFTFLVPAESLALAVALAQVLRGEAPEPNVAAVCVLGLARLDGRHDWTDDRP